MYSTNTFHPRDIGCFRRLPEFILPQRINAIRSLKLVLHLPDFPTNSPDVARQYEECWQAISNLRGLRELRVWLTLPLCNERGWRLDESAFLKPVAEMRRLDVFDFFMPVTRNCLTSEAVLGNCHVRGAEEIVVLSDFY